MIRYNTESTFSLLLYLPGSVYKKGIKRLLPASALAAIFSLWKHFQPELWKADSFKNSFAYSIFTFLLGFILVFRCNMAYQRFWEGRASIEKMTNCWLDAAIKCISFDKHTPNLDEVDVRAWRAKILGLFSLLHGSALAALTDYDQEMEIFNGVDESAATQLNLDCVRDQTYLVYTWIQDEIVDRREKGGMKAPPPIATRIWGDLTAGMQGYNDADMVLDTPFPFPYSQILAILLLLLVLTCGYIMLAFVDNAFWVITLTGVAVGTFHSLNEVAKELEQPFGADANDLPMQEYQHNFNNRMQQLLHFGEDIYEIPGPSQAAERLAAKYKNIPSANSERFDMSLLEKDEEKPLILTWRKPLGLHSDELGMQKRPCIRDLGLVQ